MQNSLMELIAGEINGYQRKKELTHMVILTGD